MKEDFRNNNFAYTGEDENIHITLLDAHVPSKMGTPSEG
jgi:hypothetical protein